MDTTRPTTSQYRRRPNPIRAWRRTQIALLREHYPELFDMLLDAGINRAAVLAAVSRNVQSKAALPSPETIRNKRPALAAQREAARVILQRWRRGRQRQWTIAALMVPPGNA